MARLGTLLAAGLLGVAGGSPAAQSAGPALAAAAPGRVVRVTDGDSLWWKPDAGGRAVRVRLKGIDAPEICQAFGLASRDGLERLLRGRPVQLEKLGVDDHGRVLARLQAPGVPDVAARLVEDGLAWSYRFKDDPGPYTAQEARAAAARKGVHQAQAPLMPRQFRLQHGPCSQAAPQGPGQRATG